MIRRLLLVAACAAASSVAQDYFPLHVGNQWVYHQEGRVGGDPIVVEIAESRSIGGQFFSLLRGLPEGPLWLRQDPDGVLYDIEIPTMRERVWARFRTPEGGTYNTTINACNSMAKVESRNDTVKVPAGEWGGALRIAYPGPTCADAGVESEVFLPWIGLVKRTSTTIAGPVTLSLMYARVGGVTVLAQPEVSFGVTLDRAVYQPGELITARLTIRSTLADPLVLNFASGQRFDMALRNRAGEVVSTWGRDKVFLQVLGSETVGGERNWVLRMAAPNEAGTYSAEGFLTATPPQNYRATVSFTVASR